MFKLNGIRFQIARNEETLHEIFRLRYQIYVEEYGFEDPADHPGGIETDKYDRQAIHLAGICEKTEKVVATLRMVYDSHLGLPITNIRDYSFGWAPQFQKNVIEVSRLAIDKAYRRADSGLLFDQAEKTDRKKPLAIFGLYRLLYHESKKRKATHWAMISEPHLHDALTSMGYIFHQIGHTIDYHGLRAPYLASLEEMEYWWLKTQSPTFSFLARGLDKEYLPLAAMSDQRLAG